MRKEKMSPVHPGEILMEEFLKPMGISQYRLAHNISVPARRINEIVHGTRRITADTALRLGRYFGMSPQFWINLQSHYDLEVEADRLSGRLDQRGSCALSFCLTFGNAALSGIKIFSLVVYTV